MQHSPLDLRRALRLRALELRRRRARGGVHVSCLDSEAAFAELGMEWNRLHARAPGATIFNSWLWQYQWWRVYGGGRPLRVLVARSAGDVTGILALYLGEETALGRPVRALRLVGTGGDTHPDDLGPVIDADDERETARALARAAVELPDGDLLLVSDLDPQAIFTEELELAARLAGRPLSRGRTERIAYIQLPGSWEQYLASLSANRRAEIRRARRRLAAHHAARFRVWDDGARLDAATRLLADLHRRRWASAGGSEAFASPQYLAFHGAIIRSSFARGWLRLYCLEIEGEMAAMLYCYRFRNRVFLMQGGFDPAWSAWKPGTVLLSYAIEQAIEEGNDVFDFLRGEHRYKDRLATGSRETVYVTALRRSLLCLAFALRPSYVPMRRNSLPARARRWLRRALRIDRAAC